MTSVALTRALIACLGIGVADVAALNVAVFPALRGEAVAVAASPVAATAPAEAKAVAVLPAPPTPPATPPPKPLPAAAAPAPIAPPVEMAAAAAPAAEIAPLAPAPAVPPASTPVAMLEFERDSHRVGLRATWTLARVFSRLRAAPEVVVVGHADASGTDEINDRISAERARAVARRLERGGIEEARIRVEARGRREPRPDGRDRRVEIYIGGTP